MIRGYGFWLFIYDEINFLKKIFKWKVLKIFIEKCVSGFGLLFYKGMMIVLNL